MTDIVKFALFVICMARWLFLFGCLAIWLTGCWCSGNYWNCARLLIRPVYKAITGMAMAVAMSMAMAMPTKCNQSQVKVKGVAAILTQKVCFKLALVEANTLFMAQSQPILKKNFIMYWWLGNCFPLFSAGQSQQRTAVVRRSVTRPFAPPYKEIIHSKSHERGR